MPYSPVMNTEMQEKAFRNVILPLKDKLFRMALRITLDSAEAEDVVQDTMIRIWDKREEWPEIESIEALCMTICKNLAIDRSQKMEAQNMELTPERIQNFQTSSPYEKMVTDESLSIVRRLIDELPEKQKLILQLRDMEGESYREIANVLQLTEEQVKVNLFRARQRIKQRFTDIENYGL